VNECKPLAVGPTLRFKVRRCMFKPIEPRVESAWFQRSNLKANWDELVSSFAFNFNLRHYIKAGDTLNVTLQNDLAGGVLRSEVQA